MRLSIATLCFLMFTTRLVAQENLEVLKPADGKPVGNAAAYGIGYNVGMNLKNEGLEAGDLAKDDLLRGILDALDGKDPAVSQEQLQEVLKALGEKIQARFNEKTKAKLAEAQKFLEENKKKEGVQVTQSGLQYKVLKAGDGATPTATSTVVAHYEGKLTDGRVFDSSVARGEPATFPVNRLIPGWQEALQRMKVGDKWQLFVPPELAYGENGPPGSIIGPNEPLIFEMELLEVK